MKRLSKLIIALCFSAVMLMGCKSKSEKLVASYLKDYEAAVVKVEKLKKDVETGKTSQQDAFGKWIGIGAEIDGLAKDEKYISLPPISEWSESDKTKKQKLDARLAAANK